MGKISPIHSNSLGFILRFGRVYPQPHPTAISGYLKFQFNHRNIKLNYICRFTLSHLLLY